MPTFKNETSRVISHRAIIQSPEGVPKESWIIFNPGEEKQLSFWLPYAKLGLTLTSENYPPVPETILISGTFNFNNGTERKFNIASCDTYVLNIIVQSGKVTVYTGNSNTGVEVRENADVPYHYKAVLDWEYAPFLKVVGKEDNTQATIHAEVDRDYLVNAKMGVGRLWQ